MLPPAWEEAIDASGMTVARRTDRSRRQGLGCATGIALFFVAWGAGVYLLEKHVPVPLIAFGGFVSGLFFLLALSREEFVAARDHLELRRALGPWRSSHAFRGASLRLVVWEDADGDLNHRVEVVTPERAERVWSCGSDRTAALLLAQWIAGRTGWRLDETWK